MSRHQFKDEMNHIAAGVYWIARQVQINHEFMTTILRKADIDDVSLDELTVCLNEIGDYVEVMTCYADDSVRVSNTYGRILNV